VIASEETVVPFYCLRESAMVVPAMEINGDKTDTNFSNSVFYDQLYLARFSLRCDLRVTVHYDLKTFTA